MATEFTEEVGSEFAGWSASQTGVEAPLLELPASTPSPVASFRQETAPVPTAPRSDSGRRLEAHLLSVLAAAVALPALRAPVTWLMVCATVAIVLVAADTATGRAKATGAADVVVVPARAVGRVLLGFVNPINWLKVLLGALGSLAVGALAGARSRRHGGW